MDLRGGNLASSKSDGICGCYGSHAADSAVESQNWFDVSKMARLHHLSVLPPLLSGII